MTDNLLEANTEQDAGTSGKPANLPEKFWDADTGTVRVEALLSSYLALEKKLSSTIPFPASDEDRIRTYKALGLPDTPDDYALDLDGNIFDADSEINARLHATGFTPEQAQLVYDLAAEKLAPLIMELAGEFQADREVERLTEHFGGPEKWREISRQLLAFGKKNLPPDVLDGLSGSYEGVLALHRMMKADGPAMNRKSEAAESVSDRDLQAMMRDRRYWRDRDPAFVAKVTEGFKQMYGE